MKRRYAALCAYSHNMLLVHVWFGMPTETGASSGLLPYVALICSKCAKVCGRRAAMAMIADREFV